MGMCENVNGSGPNIEPATLVLQASDEQGLESPMAPIERFGARFSFHRDEFLSSRTRHVSEVLMLWSE